MEGGVKHSHLGHVGTHHVHAGLDAGDVGGVVQGGQGDALFQGGHYLIVDAHGAGEGLPAVDHPVTHRIDLTHGGNHAVVLVHQGIHNGLDGLRVGGHSHVHSVQHLLARQLGLVGELAVNADALTQALGQQFAGGGIQQLVLQR